MANQTLSAAQQSQLTAMGIDWQKIDWSKVITILQLLASLFTAQQADTTAGVKAAGCPDEYVDHCCKCCEAGCLAIQSAELSFQCCDDMCKP